MKKVLLLFALLIGACVAYAADVTIIPPTTLTGVPSWTDDSGIYKIVTAKNDGSTAPTYKSNGKDLRIYAKGTITISTTDESEFTKVVFNISTAGLKRLAPITASVGAIATQSSGDKTVTWTGNASSVTFTVGDNADFGTESSKAGQLCFTDFVITTVDTQDDREEVILEFDKSEVAFDINDKILDLPAITVNPAAAKGEVRYSSKDENVATVNATTGAVTLKGLGTTTIYAKIESSTKYRYADASYSLTVYNGSLDILDANTFGKPSTYSITEWYSVGTLIDYHAYLTTCTAKEHPGCIQLSKNNGYSIYSSNNQLDRVIKQITVNVAGGNNGINIYCSTMPFDGFSNEPTTGNKVDTFKGTGTTGDISKEGYKYFLITSATGAVYISSIEIEYVPVEDFRQRVNLWFSEELYTATLGDEFTTPVLNCDVDGALSSIKYTSSNESVALVDNEGNITLIDDGATTISAYIQKDNSEYYATPASYDLVVKSPGTIETVLNADFFASSNYDVYTKTDDKTGIEYTSVQFKSNGMQFNISNQGCGLAVTATSPNYIISSISIDFYSPGAGLNVFKQNEAFNKNKSISDPIKTSNAQQVGGTVTKNTTIAIGAPAFALVPAGSGAIQITSITVTYAKNVADDGAEMFRCDDFTTHMINLGDTYTLNVGEKAPVITYTSSNPEVASINAEGVISALKPGNTVITASWEAVAGKWMAGSKNFIVYAKYSSLAQVLEDAKNENSGFVVSGQTYVGNFPVVVGADMGAYNYVTDGETWALFYVGHNHGEGAVLDAGWSGTLYYDENGVPMFTNIEHSDVTDKTGEYVINEYTEIKDNDLKVNEVIILKNVKFDDMTPQPVGVNFTGDLNGQVLNFNNFFEIASVEAGYYDVKCAVSMNGEDLVLYPIAYTFVAEIPQVYTAVGTVEIVPEQHPEADYKVNNLCLTVNVYNEDQELVDNENGDYMVLMNGELVGFVGDKMTYLPYDANAVFTVQYGDRQIPVEIEGWKSIAGATTTIDNLRYRIGVDPDDASKGHLWVNFELGAAHSIDGEVVTGFKFSGDDYVLETEHMDGHAMIYWENGKVMCQLSDVKVVDMDGGNIKNEADLAFEKISITPLFSFLVEPAAQQNGRMRAPSASNYAICEVEGVATPINHESAKEYTNEGVSGVADVVVDGEAVVEFYNLQGVKVEGELAPGLYIRRQGNEATKVIVK